SEPGVPYVYKETGGEAPALSRVTNGALLDGAIAGIMVDRTMARGGEVRRGLGMRRRRPWRLPGAGARCGRGNDVPRGRHGSDLVLRDRSGIDSRRRRDCGVRVLLYPAIPHARRRAGKPAAG